MTLLPGYFSAADDPGEVFQCTSKSACPGGVPGTCAVGRDVQTIACSQCLPGLSMMYDGSCRACDGRDYALFVVVLLAALLGIAVVYLSLVKDSKERHTSSKLIVVLGLIQLVTTVQILAVMSRFGITWRAPFANILRVVDILSFDVEALSLDCVGGSGSVATFILRAMVMPLLIVMALLVHVCYLLATRSFGDFKMKLLMKTIGTLFMIFFIIFFTMVLAPFQCRSHPNGNYTVQRYPAVLCSGDGEHLQLFIVGGLAILIPIFFLVVCTWIVIVEIPRRIATSDAEFIDSVSFLVKRFRPGAEIFSVLFLLRNALVVLCPLADAKSSKVMLMSLVMYANIILVSYFKPWRFAVCNFLDIALSCGTMLVLDMGSAVVNDVDPQTIAVVVLIVVVIMLGAILVTMGFGIYRLLQQRFYKQFKFFLCHQKAGAGSTARLLKMELEKHYRGTKTFVDCDDLNDLTRLFSYVAQDTETFVILGSPAIFTRKWCVGEMVTAMRAEVDTVILAWPRLELPNEKFIEDYSSLVPDITELTKYGIGLEEIKATFRWLLTVDVQPIHDRMTADSVSSIVRNLSAQRRRGITTPPLRMANGNTSSMSSRSQDSHISCNSIGSRGRDRERQMDTPKSLKTPILYDHDNLEAGACALVLNALLRPKLVGTHVPLPSLLSEGTEVSPSTRTALIICSENCFRSFQMQEWLLQCCELPKCAVMPVISEDGFVIPSLRSLGTPNLGHDQLQQYALILKAIFQEIAVVFVPQNYSSTHEDLQLRASKAASRLTKKTLTPLAEKVAKLRCLEKEADDGEDGKELRNDADEGDMEAEAKMSEPMVELVQQVTPEALEDGPLQSEQL